MSGEYFGTGDETAKFYKEYGDREIGPEKNDGKGGTSDRQDYRLHEIEDQLQMAETRCNTLKGQLDYMKQLYGSKSGNSSPKSAKLERRSSQTKEDKILSASSLSESLKENAKILFRRQNSNAISTDNSGAAVRTINDILNGITDSVNRLSELHVQVSDTPRSSRLSAAPAELLSIDQQKKEAKNHQSHSKIVTDQFFGNQHKEKKPQSHSKLVSDESGVILGVTVDSPTTMVKMKPKKKIKEIAQNKQNTQFTRKCSKYSLEKNIKKSNQTLRSTDIEKDSSATLNKRRPLKRLRPNARSISTIRSPVYNNCKKFANFSAHKLVEIYHNSAAKESDSDDSQNGKRKSKQSKRKCVPPHDIPPLQIKDKSDPNVNGNSDVKPHESFDEGFGYEEPEAPRLDTIDSKNYALPTIASKMKQVAKCYLNTFNFKAIPFCAATSTSPSHNIGINIQQVMNIIKNRQPIHGVSPTLAHNIGLAAEGLKFLRGVRSNCPLSKTGSNIQQLQEIAKCIPDDAILECDEDDGLHESPKIETVIITGPSGDMEVQNRQQTVWTVKPSDQQTCTCVAQRGVDFHQILNKYQCNSHSIMDSNSQVYSTVRKQPKKVTNLIKSKSRIKKSLCVMKPNGLPINTEVVEPTPLQGKEKNLKEVLTNLHDEFDAMNNRYEELSNKASTNQATEETLKEIGQLEVDLTKKEEEITMVMALYKEVMALKQQVKTLKLKTSQASVLAKDGGQSKSFWEYNNPTTAFHLTKLLRQIQYYQMHFKRDSKVF